MTKDDVYRVEHGYLCDLLTDFIVECGADKDKAANYMHYINGMNDFASVLVMRMAQEERQGEGSSDAED